MYSTEHKQFRAAKIWTSENTHKWPDGYLSAEKQTARQENYERVEKQTVTSAIEFKEVHYNKYNILNLCTLNVGTFGPQELFYDGFFPDHYLLLAGSKFGRGPWHMN